MASSNNSNLAPATPPLKIDEHFIQSKIFFISFILGSLRICMFRLSDTIADSLTFAIGKSGILVSLPGSKTWILKKKPNS